MWAHYADEHQGCVIEFDARHKVFAGQSSLREVKYSQERARYKYGDQSAAHLYQKSLDWEKEQEWRMLGEFSRMLPVTHEDENTKSTKTIHLAEIPPETVTATYLDVRMKPEVIAEFEQLHQTERKHVRLFRSGLGLKNFALCFAPYSTSQG